jgi:hypothetical protein
MSWMHSLNASGEVVACYVSVERCQGLEDPKDSMPALCNAVRDYASFLIFRCLPCQVQTIAPSYMLADILGKWAALCAPKPLVVLFDEVDTLSGQTLISFLRQLRGGFATRGVGRFPTSVALVGMRDLKDYLITTKDGVALNPGSPFNIKEDSLDFAQFLCRGSAGAFAATHRSYRAGFHRRSHRRSIHPFGRATLAGEYPGQALCACA